MKIPGRHYFAPAILGLGLAGALWFWVVTEREQAKASAHVALENTATAVLGAFRGSLQGEVISGRLQCERLQKLIDNVVGNTEVRCVRFVANGKPVAEAGKVKIKLPKANAGQVLDGGIFYKWETVFLQKPPTGRGRGRGWGQMKHRMMEVLDVDLGKEPQTILIGYSAQSYNDQLASSERRIMGVFVAGLLAIIALVVGWIMSRRDQQWREKLVVADSREEQFQEFELAAFGLAHETKHPLGIIRGLAQRMVDRNGVPESEKETLLEIMQESDIAVARLGEFMTYAKLKSPEKTDVDLTALIDRAQDVMLPDFDSAGVAFEVDCCACTVAADKDMMMRVLINLLSNALEACHDSEGGCIKVQCSTNRQVAELVVSDNGCGIPDDFKAEIFKPYVTGTESGHGIGLAVVKRISEQHGWRIECQSEVGKGTEFRITEIECVHD